jgi:hypothetical protein
MNTRKMTALMTVMLGMAMVGVLTTSCHKSSSSTPQTLYDSLGGTTMVADPANSGAQIEKGYLGIRTVVDSAIFIIAGDTVINGYFQVLLAEVTSGNLSGYQRLSANLSNFVAVATGAKDYKYTGLTMQNAHNPANNPRIPAAVMSADFDEFVKDVAASAARNGVPSNLITSLGNLLYSVESQVINQ